MILPEKFNYGISFCGTIIWLILGHSRGQFLSKTSKVAYFSKNYPQKQKIYTEI